jgi:hypothetical protein
MEVYIIFNKDGHPALDGYEGAYAVTFPTAEAARDTMEGVCDDVGTIGTVDDYNYVRFTLVSQ